MIQLKIGDNEEIVARTYRNMIKKEGIRKDSLVKLSAIKNDFPLGSTSTWIWGRGVNTQIEVIDNRMVRDYIDLLLKMYDSLLLMHPKKFYHKIQRFENIIPRDRINCKIQPEKPSLSSRIVTAMGYDKMREKVYPHAARQLNVKTCVYCNANYAIADSNGEAYFDLDHWKPKSLYPYLCTTFYNLQPSCPSCNRRKSNKDNKKFFRLWNDGNRAGLESLKFEVESANIAKYWIQHHKDDIKVTMNYVHPHDRKLLLDTEESLHITTRYQEHNDVAEEILWKAKVYNSAFWDSFEKGLATLPLSDSEKKRFILGTYPNSEEIFLRPLSKMIQDVAKEVGLVV